MADCKRSSSVSSSAAIIGGNDDLLTEILNFVPAKSLVRFKVVSKQWRTLISSHSFSLLHVRHHLRRRNDSQHSFVLGGATSQFFLCTPTVKKLVPYCFPFPFHRVRILQSCNGLLLLQCRNPYDKLLIDYCVFNPTTKNYRNLFLNRGFYGLCLIFDPSESHHYKVVCIKYDGSVTSFHVYDSDTHEWRYGGETHLRGPYRFQDGLCCNGRLYFIRIGQESFCYSAPCKLYEVCKIPRNRVKGAKKNYIMESNGHLLYLGLSLKPDENFLHVYEMENESYIDFLADSNPISATFAGDNVKHIELLGMIRGEREEDSVLVYHVPGKIMIYRFCDGVCEELVDLRRCDFYEEGQLQFRFKHCHPLIESLAPV